METKSIEIQMVGLGLSMGQVAYRLIRIGLILKCFCFSLKIAHPFHPLFDHHVLINIVIYIQIPGRT